MSPRDFALRVSPMNEESKTLKIMRRIGAPEPEKIRITGILKSPELAFLTLVLPSEDGDSLAALLSLLGAREINIRFISKYANSAGTTTLNLCVEEKALTPTLELIRAQAAALGIRDLSHRPHAVIISIYPHKERARVAERLFTTLRINGIEPLAANNASSVISCVFRSNFLPRALACLDQAFELP